MSNVYEYVKNEYVKKSFVYIFIILIVGFKGILWF